MLGRYLGPEVDFDLRMTANIIKGNGEVVHRLTQRGLKEDDNFNQAHISLRKEFDNIIIDKLGPDISPENFPDVDLEDMPLYEMYEDDAKDA